MKNLTLVEVKQHVVILGWLHIVTHILYIIFGIGLFLFLSSVGAVSNDPQALAILSVIGSFVGSFLTLLGIPGLLAGIGLLTHKPWGRYLAIVVAFLEILNFPIGTLVGAYTLWVLFQEPANDYFMLQPT